ncbi:MAG: glycosyltransferase family 1 protein, partial [Gordonia sp. (in: high G+C Gram-positive bacteria)]
MREVVLLCWRDTDHPQGGGSERYLERVGAELARRGARVTLLTARYPGSARS